jgi:hypothetical protein
VPVHTESDDDEASLVEGSGQYIGAMAEDDVGDVGQNVRGLTGDKDWTNGDERKDELLRTVGKLIKPSARKRHIIGREKKTELG